MNAVPEGPAAAEPGPTMVDELNPWLGLASFTEETRAYFYGREEEVAELARRVQRKLLTVLFGQSGLGKTSILRAGLVPRLRGQGYCPIYVRIDYAREAPEPAEQIKQAIRRTARRSGEWTQVGVAVAGESLWEFLHHRDDVLHDESGATLIPLLIFDQFEEIFTLAQSDDFGRARAARFIADLADLVENRPPQELEARLEADESAAERFDFTRSDYRVLIALREDYLAPLEGLKAAMPSITQNRLRLAPMTGQQALAAVMRPGRQLVTEEVAAAIVRFVAGGAELANAEVEPSLLSLICRELNDTRIAEGRSEISLDLLAGSHESILSNFYERALADQPPAVRRIIEDELLTESGFRENVAEERLLGSFVAAGAAPDTLSVLVNRRLLRMEERLDVRRAELTHDVLCGVVKQSRDLRHECEARDATERLLAEQRAREQAARRSLTRARRVAAVCAVLALGALLAAALAYVSTQRARRAEREAVQARATADEMNILTEQARGQAEQLLGYLTDDFSRELESFGRLDIVAELARREVDYFKALPPALKVGDTSRNGALAMVYYAKAMRGLGKIDEAGAASAEAVQLLEKLRQGGDGSEATTIALALGTMVQGVVFQNRQDAESLPTMQRAAALLKPIAEAPKASLDARRAYVQVLDRVGLEQSNSAQNEAALATLGLAVSLAEGAGARDLSNLDMAAEYTNCAAWQVYVLMTLGRNAEARRIGADGSAVADRLLKLRPNYVFALRGQQLIANGLAQVAVDDLHNGEAIAIASRAREVSITLTRLDPGNTVAASNLANDLQVAAQARWQTGKPREAVAYLRASYAQYRATRQSGASFLLNGVFAAALYALRQGEIGDVADARAVLAQSAGDLDVLRRTEPAGSVPVAFGDCLVEYGEAGIALGSDDPAGARRLGQVCIGRMAAVHARGPEEEFWRNVTLFWHGSFVGQAEYQLGNYAAAERSLREALASRSHVPTHNNGDRRDQASVATLLAMSLARNGNSAEAARVIAPVVRFQRELAARNHDDQWQHVELGSALYAEALAEPVKRDALLTEAATLIASVPAEMRQLRSVRLWRERIAEAQRGRAAGEPAGATSHDAAG